MIKDTTSFKDRLGDFYDVNKEMIQGFDHIKDSVSNYGPALGLLGVFLEQNQDESSPFSMDLARNRFSYSPSSNLELYMEPETDWSGESLLPEVRGLNLGLNYNF